jgi:hypothetical protein
VRLTKMFGPAVLSAVAATAFVGTNSAGAQPHEAIGLCNASELVLCAAENLIPVGSGHLIGKATSPVLERTLAEKCASSLAKGLVTGALGETSKLEGKIDELTFTSCSPCSTVTVNNLPLTTELTMGTGLGDDWQLTTKGNATFSSCTFGLICKFGAERIVSLIEMTEAGAVLNTNKAVLNFEGGNEFFCGKVGKWNAKYALSWELLADGKDDAVWPTLLGKA